MAVWWQQMCLAFLAMTALNTIAQEDTRPLLTVLYTGTDTVDARPFYQKFTQTEFERNNALIRAQRRLRDIQDQSAVVTPADYFPVRSHRLSLGSAQRISVDAPIQSMAIVGMDDYSMQWLASVTNDIKRDNVHVVVVDADSFAAFRELQRRGKLRGISITARSGDALAEVLGFATYPMWVAAL